MHSWQGCDSATAQAFTILRESSSLFPYAGRGYYAILAQTLIFVA
ncbi:hypothetical protein ACLED1_12150 [Lonsdalea quercina]